MAKKEKEESLAQEKMDRVSTFVTERKEIYLQEYRDASTDVEKFIWSEMIGLLDEISAITEAESL
jgi:hypothetical protein